MKIRFEGERVVRDDENGDYEVEDSAIFARFSLVEGEVVDLCEGMNDEEAAAHLVELEAEAAAALREEHTPPTGTRVTKLAFRNRFTQEEKIKIDLASIHDSSLAKDHPANLAAAGLRQSLKDQENATFIDLARSDTRAGVQALEAFTILAEGRAAEILDSPIQPIEVYKGD